MVSKTIGYTAFLAGLAIMAFGSAPALAESLMRQVTSASHDLGDLATYLKEPDQATKDGQATQVVIRTQSLTIIDTRAPDAPVRFDEPLTAGAPEIVGLTLSGVIGTKPAFPPIEGLPEIAWKDQHCSNCHKWERASLCEQGQFYVKNASTTALSKQHPFGGSFKQSLRSWAVGGCK